MERVAPESDRDTLCECVLDTLLVGVLVSGGVIVDVRDSLNV